MLKQGRSTCWLARTTQVLRRFEGWPPRVRAYSLLSSGELARIGSNSLGSLWVAPQKRGTQLVWIPATPALDRICPITRLAHQHDSIQFACSWTSVPLYLRSFET